MTQDKGSQAWCIESSVDCLQQFFYVLPMQHLWLHITHEYAVCVMTDAELNLHRV